MLPKSLLVFAVVSVSVRIISKAAVIRPRSDLSVLNGEGFIAYLEVDEDFGEIINCWFRVGGNEKKVIDLNATEPIKIDRNESILPYAKDICGIRVNGVSTESETHWTLEAESVNGVVEQGLITVEILPYQKTNFDKRMISEIGKSTVKCSINPIYTKYCKIFDVYTGQMHYQCELFTNIRPNSMFECFMYNSGRMEVIREHIFIDIKNSTLYTNSTLETKENFEILRCDFLEEVHSCQAEMPDRKTELLIMDGLYNGRYSAYHTETAQSRCELEIPKPFKENEIGLWRIINSESNTPSGCLFYVGKSKQDIIIHELFKRRETSTIKVYDTETNIDIISCSLPFVIYDCYLKDPNNTVYFPVNEHFKRQRLYGECVFYNMPVIAGIWHCGARGRDYDKELVQNIEVIVKSKYGETLTRLIEAKRGDSVELMCKTPFQEPISHCAFIDPQGAVHLVGTKNSFKTNGHVQYYGRGISKGECGIKISKVNRDDYGQWKCQFLLTDGRLKSSFLMELKESDIFNATSAGLGVGVTVILVLILSVIIGTIFYRRRNLSANHDFATSDTLEMPTSSGTPT
ncbi:hypothetical protein DOY81_007336 [Sarcophaga bullata]|nr:hypothetical protein DOY81_007336 [Sarcophaga bullata]